MNPAKALGYRLYCTCYREWPMMIIFIICIPVMAAYICFYLKSEVEMYRVHHFPSPFTPPPVDRNMFLSKRLEVPLAVVSPDNESTNKLMKAAMNLIPSKETKLEFKQNADEVNAVLSNWTRGSIYPLTQGFGIIFGDISKSKLVYTLRSTESNGWYTTENFPKIMLPGPMENEINYIQTGFLQLQIAINTAYSTKILNLPGRNWQIQAFPYPPYTINEGFEMFFIVVKTITIVSIIFVLTKFATYLVHEKYSGIKEIMKVNGLNEYMIFFSWIALFGVITLLIAIAVTVIWKLPTKHGAVMPYTSPGLIFLILIVYYWASLCSVSFVASLVVNPKYCMIIVFGYWIGSYVIVYEIIDTARTTSILILLALLPNGGLCGVFDAITEFEAAETEVNLSDLFVNPSVEKVILPMGVNLIIMVLSMFIFISLTVYVDAIKPGPFGRAKSWYFILPQFIKSSVCNASESQNPRKNLLRKTEPILIENVDGQVPVALKVEHLVKQFGSFTAVDDLSFSIYKDEITVLLGHNGAGKTTFFSMLSGMYSPTSGSIHTDTYNVFEGKNIRRFRQEFGYCPQNDILIAELTVKQHLILFSMIKGLSFKQSREQFHIMTTQFKLEAHRNKRVSQLSGGMKRKLCLSIALVGKPKYLFLDEPTSGLDPESRREIWGILLSLRGNCTTVITTHFMEEADILADRIAIISNGKLKCTGSTLFLKLHYNLGYQLSVTTDKIDSENISNQIQRHVSSAKVVRKTGKTVTLSLPASSIHKFPDLLRSLNNKQVNATLSSTTMDDVFLRVQEDEGVNVYVVNMPTQSAQRQLFVFIWLQQLNGLAIKRLKLAWYNWKSLLFFILILPVLAMYLTVLVCNNTNDDLKIVNMSLTMDRYSGFNAFIAQEKGGSDLSAHFIKKAIIKSGSSYTIIDSNKNITSALLELATSNLINYRTKTILSFEIKGLLTALYSTIPYHALPIAYGTVANALIYMGGGNSTIVTYNFPYTNKERNCQNKSGEIIIYMGVWIIIFGIAILITTSYFVILPHTERITHFKHLELMTGLWAEPYWLILWIIDVMIYSISVLLSIITIIITDRNHMFTEFITLKVLLVVLILYGISNISFAYFCSFLFKTYTSAMEIFIFVSLAGAILNALVILYYYTKWISYVLYLIPWLPLINALISIILWNEKITNCEICTVGTSKKICEDIKNNVTIRTIIEDKEFIYLACDGLFYLVLILLTDHGIFKIMMGVIRRLLYGGIQVVPNEFQDVAVKQEKAQVDKEQSSTENPVIFQCEGLGKKYGYRQTAVCDVTFSIHKGECFGLLGINGAGKSTTFGMLTRSIIPTKGSAKIMKYDLTTNTHNYLKRLGYCPQQNSLLLELSAEEIISLFARLRGIPPSELANIRQIWIESLEMNAISHKPCRYYSGGNKRKLCMAMAMIANPPVVLLDEPTTGVDPVVRRKIWSILKHSLEINGQTVIITSHSMDECEAVCERLTIMVKGVMKCIGTIPELKKQYGQRCVLQIKLVQSSSPEKQTQLQSQIENLFKPHIQLQYKKITLLHYTINTEKFNMADIVSTMLNVKNSNQVIEDFTVSDISLEDVFVSFAAE